MKKRKSWIEDTPESFAKERRVREEHEVKKIKRKSFKLFMEYIKKAHKKRIEFYLPEIRFAKLASLKCKYCGGTPTGFERINKEIGYTTQNSIPVCSTCIGMKGFLSEERFASHCAKIARFYENSIPTENNPV